MEPVTDPNRGTMRNAGGDGVQATVWVVAMLSVLVLLALGVAWGMKNRFSIQSPGVSPDLPTLPGKTPEPNNP
ncbi:MAG: hypothetical protein K0R38_1725 [Polyangiaceae bacterium]|jgi:hypothetical protein|nr:hypothetical protein [Polyangiaceae bacterium]